MILGTRRVYTVWSRLLHRRAITHSIHCRRLRSSSPVPLPLACSTASSSHSSATPPRNVLDATHCNGVSVSCARAASKEKTTHLL